MPDSPLSDPDYLPFKLDLAGRRLLLLRLSERQRAEAAFLDERALPPDASGGWLPLDALDALEPPAGTVPPAPDFVFHVGHCGSTLLSRLLQAWPELQVLREPLPLRTLAAEQADGRDAAALLDALLALWARPQSPRRRVLVKATSSCNGLAGPILRRHRSVRAVLLSMPLPDYLATLFKARSSLGDAINAAPERLRDLAARSGDAGLRFGDLPPPALCALGWLAERLRFDALAQGPSGARVLRVDFDDVLSSPRQTLQAIARHLGLDPAGVEGALSSPAWGRYSKAEDHRYDAGDRRHDLALARQRFGAEIEAGLAAVDGYLRRFPALAATADIRPGEG